MIINNNLIQKSVDIPWWKNGVIYQIYPKSFQASSNKSTGDLQGIIRRLDYIQGLGVSAIWLTPIYPSPQIDNGYDISNYCDINPDYGTMRDFEKLTDAAHQYGIRIMMDMVFNHTSTEHPWFKSALDKNSPYRSFYIWQDEKKTGMPPNNWQSKFGGSAWEWHQKSKQFYLHLFAKEQADLNWENPNVRQELKKICQFWVEKGVDALRLDVINLVSKDLNFPDDDTGDGRKFYTDGPRIHEFLQEMSRDVFQPNGLITVGEMSSTSLDNCQKYANLAQSELSMTFNFHHLKVDYPHGDKWTIAKPDLIELKKIFHHWQTGMYKKAWNALFWCNHDQPRIVSRFGDENEFHTESAKMLAMALYGLQGTPYLFQGEEIGMTNPHFTDISEYRDIESLNIYQQKKSQGLAEEDIIAILACKSRDNSRTPMQWDTSENAGFTRGKPWIQVSGNYHNINVEAALKDKNSIYYCYRDLITLRKKMPIFVYGNYVDHEPNSPELWCYSRHFENSVLFVVANFSPNNHKWDIPTELTHYYWDILYSNYRAQNNLTRKHLMIKPYQAVYFYAEK